MDKELADYLEGWCGYDYFDRHIDRLFSWPNKRDALPKHQSIVKKHFGLSMWISTIRLSEASSRESYFPAEATLAYLRLPSAPPITQTLDVSHSECESWEPFEIVETGCAVDVSTHLSRPRDTDARFKRALRILGLKPFEHKSQRGLGVCPNQESEDESEESEESKASKASNYAWPRLLTLVHTSKK